MAATKIKKRQIENLQIVDADIAAAAAIAISKIAGLNDALDSKEPAFTKNTAFNKNFGTASGTVAEGDHTHSFSQLTDIPTTLAGFGITDAYTKSESDAITGDLGNLETTDKSNLVAALNELNGVVSDAVKPPLPIDCSGNPDYPAANKGDSYKVTKAGLIGGENGISVDVGDLMIASVDTPAGDHATVGANWGIYQANLDKATESVFGTGRIATTAEVTAGTNDQAWVTPAKLAAGFFSKTQLQTSGQAQVHWGNITNAPAFITAETDPIYTLQEPSIYMTRTAVPNGTDLNDFTDMGVWRFTSLTTGILNLPDGYPMGTSILNIHNSGVYILQELYRANSAARYYRTSTAGGWTPWEVAATQRWVSENYVTLGTAQTITGLKTLVGGNPLRLQAATEAAYISIYASDGTTRKAYIGFPVSSPNDIFINNDGGGTLKVKSGINGLTYGYGSGDKTVWHAGNLTPVDAAKYVAKEALAGAKDGSNKTFTLANTPIAGKEMIFLNGQLLQSGSGADYTISGTTVTLTDNQAAPVADDVILGTYIY